MKTNVSCSECYCETRCKEHDKYLIENNPTYDMTSCLSKASDDCFIPKDTSEHDVSVIKTIRHIEMHNRLGW